MVYLKKRNVKQFIHLLQEQYTNDNNISMYVYMIIYDYNLHI